LRHPPRSGAERALGCRDGGAAREAGGRPRTRRARPDTRPTVHLDGGGAPPPRAAGGAARMKILHVAALAADVPSGPATSVPLQMVAEARAGHEVAFLQSAVGQPIALPAGVRRLGDPRGRQVWRDLFAIGALFERARFWPDIVHFHSVYLVQHALAARAVRRLGLPTVNSPRGGLMPAALATSRAKKRLADLLFFDRFCRGLALHRALTEAERRACRLRYPEVPALVAANPVDLDARARVRPPRVADRPLALGYLGRLDVHYKGLDLLLAGLIEALRLGPHVQLGEPLEGERRRAFFADVDVFVHPSRSEGLPMGVLEAMAAARPVVVTPETNLGDVVERHRAGWLVAGNASALGRLLSTLPAQAGELAARGEAARRAACAEFSLEAVGVRLARAYAAVCRRREAVVA